MPTRTDLDHIALASEHAWENFDRYRGDLGGEWAGGGIDPGYYWGQVAFANGMRVEVLEPVTDHPRDFLRRFLDRSGPGPHHLTFKVTDIRARIDAATAAGHPPVEVNLEHSGWKEAFLHPRTSCGIVIQLAETAENPSDHAPGAIALPPPRDSRRAALVRLVHLVAALEPALELFAGVLEGQVTARDEGPEGRWADLAWPGPGRLRLLEPAEDAARAWLGARPGRIHHLEFSCPDPGGVRQAIRLSDGLHEIPPESNLGTRLRLHAP